MELHNNHITNNLHYEIALTRLVGIGNIMHKTLVSHLGSAAEVFQSPASKLSKIPGIGQQLLHNFKQKEEALKAADKIISDSTKKEIQILHHQHPLFPSSLKLIFDSPPIIYVKGKGSFKPSRTIALVGSRDGTDYGRGVIDQLVANLPDVQVISGLAFGIDVWSHKAALQYKQSTIAVLANSLETVYPIQHLKIAEEIEETGLLVSEQPIHTPLHPSFFLSRNRIIAALAEVTVVVESKKKGGSMVTAEFANNYHREVFAVPGDIQRKLSEGPNELIFNHKAQIYLHPLQLLKWMNWDTETKPKKIKIDWSQFSEVETKILKILQEKGDTLIDELSWQSGLSLNQLSSILLQLEFQDVIKQTPGKKFALKK